MSFSELLPLVEEAAKYLEHHTIRSKEELDRVLAQLIAEQLPAQKQSLWNAPSMYGAPDRRRLEGAAVSFLLRPCSFKGLVVLGNGIASPRPSPPRCAGLGTSWFHLHKAQPSLHGPLSARLRSRDAARLCRLAGQYPRPGKAALAADRGGA